MPALRAALADATERSAQARPTVIAASPTAAFAAGPTETAAPPSGLQAVVAGLVSFIGLTPRSGLDTPGAPSPVQPLTWAVLGWVRRVSEQSYLDESRTPAYSLSTAQAADPVQVSSPDRPTVDYEIINDWGSGYTAAVTVTAGDSNLNGWTVEFDSPSHISSLWNATLVSQDDGHYVVSNPSWNPTIGAGQSATFYFNASPGGTAATVSGFTLNGESVDDPPPVLPTVSISDPTLAEGASGTQDVAFTVTLSEASNDPITIDYSTTDGTATAGEDYTATSGTLTFAPGQLSQQVFVPIHGDTIAEPDETITLMLSNAHGANLTDATATATINNDDGAAVGYTVLSNWGSGYLAQVTITAGDYDVDGWTVQFDTDSQITNLWNGQIVGADDGHYVISNAFWNGTIPAGQSVTFGFLGVPGGAAANATGLIVNGEVVGTNHAPVAADDAFTVNEDQTLTSDVLANDSDIDTTGLTAALVTGPTNGALALNPDGSFTYTPDADFAGADSFTYTASDGQLTSNTATVSITVTAVNDAPVAADDAFTVNEDQTLTGDVLANDTDIDTTGLTAALVTGPTNGALALNPDGSFTYTPDADFAGADSFTYTASDGQLTSNTATVSITVTAVNDAPVAADDAFTVNEDQTLTGDVLANDSDIDTTGLTAALVTGPTNGTLALNPDGSFTYTPDADFAGADSFTYTASDGQLTSNTATVSITVTAVNDAPVAADIDVQVAEDNSVLVDLSSAGFDVDGDAFSVAVTQPPSHGSLVDNGDGTFTYTPDADFPAPTPSPTPPPTAS